ncbi:ras-domain-containing protein [Serendipita vermifera]|nr:ras-domain-containing protein [Serendipita vermifera]
MIRLSEANARTSIRVFGKFSTIAIQYILPPYMDYSKQGVKTDRGQAVDIAAWHFGHGTGGDSPQLRGITYQYIDAFLICFSVDDRDSFEHVEQKWLPEILYFSSGIPFILVACKIDLRNNAVRLEEMERRREKMVSTEEGEVMAQRIGAKAHIECSSLDRTNVDEVFQKATSIAVTYPRPKRRKFCRIL